MPRLLLLSRCPPLPLYLGDRLIVWHLTRELGRMGVTIDLIALANRREDADEVADYAHLFAQVTLIPETPRTPFQYLARALNPRARFPRRPEQAWHPAFWHAISAHLDRHRYDALHLFGGLHVYEFWHALRGQAAVITPYESYALLLARQLREQPANLELRLRWLLARALESWMYTPYQRAVVLAEADRNALAALNPRYRLEVIPNGVDLDYFQPQAVPRDPATLLFVGNYAYPPNLEAAWGLVDELLPRVRASVPEARLLLVGNAPPPDLLARQSDSITVTGRVDDVRPYYARATAFVCPLRVGAGIKNKVLEALAMATPIVGTPLSFDGIGAAHDHEALVADYDDLAEQVVRLLRAPALGERLSAAGRALVEARFSWRSVAARYWELYGW